MNSLFKLILFSLVYKIDKQYYNNKLMLLKKKQVSYQQFYKWYFTA